MSETLDASFERLLADVGEEDAAALRSLPRRLGISTSESGGWDDYSKLEPMRTLPSFAAPLCPDLSDEDLDAFVLAHRAAGFAGLVVDRILDGQVAGDEFVCHAARVLVDRWIDALARATRLPAGNVTGPIRAALERLSAAAEREQRFFDDGIERGEHYASLVADKTAWLGLASRFMLHLHGTEGAEVDFDRCFESLLLGLQMTDDALDDEEDRALRGRSVPDCLDLEPTSLFVASERILTEAETEMRAVGLDTLADFCASQALALGRAVGPVSAADGLGAIFLLAEVVGREALRESFSGDRAILGACAHGFDSTNVRPSSSAWYWPAAS